MKTRRSLAILLTLILLSTPCLSETEQTTKIGVILPLSGSFKRYGERIQAALTEGIDCNAKLIFEDESCDPNKAMTAYKKLSSVDGINLFIGPYCGSPQLVIAQQIKTREQLAMLASSAPTEVYTASAQKMFSTQHSIESEASYMAQYLNKLGVKSVASIYLDNYFSRTHENAFKKAFKGTILKTFAYTGEDLSQIKSLVLSIKGLKPEALYVPDAFPLMNGLTRELEAAGLNQIKIYSPYSVEMSDVLNAVGKAGERIFYTYPQINEEALHYYSKIAASQVCNGIKNCPAGDISCIKAKWLSDALFDKTGSIPAEFIIKTMTATGFVEVKS